MPAAFFLQQHGSLEAIQARLGPSERLMAILDDICCVSSPKRRATCSTAIQANGSRDIDAGSSKVRFRCDCLARRCLFALVEQGVTVSETLVGHLVFVMSRLAAVLIELDPQNPICFRVICVLCVCLCIFFCFFRVPQDRSQFRSPLPPQISFFFSIWGLLVELWPRFSPVASVRVWVPLGRAVKLRWPLARTKVPDLEDRQIGVAAFGWQQAATDAVHTHVVGTSVRPRLKPIEQANVSPKAIVGVPFQCFLSDVVSRPSCPSCSFA